MWRSIRPLSISYRHRRIDFVHFCFQQTVGIDRRSDGGKHIVVARCDQPIGCQI
jgi:hypothetical protein